MRLLFTAACGFASAALAAHYALPFAWLPWCALALFALALPALLLRGDARTRAVLLLVSAALGAGWYWGYTQLFVRPAEALAGRELSFTARVLESPERDEGFAMTYVRLAQEGLPAVRTAVYDYDGYLGDVQPGDLVELTARTSSATERYGAETDIYSSRGILLRANLSAPSGGPRRDGWSWLYFPARLSAAVGEKAQQLFPADTAGFMRALLVGDSSGLDDDYELEHALDESGIRHVVAVSGMHLSYLCAFLTALLGRRRAAKLGVPAAVVFTFMAGATPSIVRACVMLLLVMAAPLARREAGALTAWARRCCCCSPSTRSPWPRRACSSPLPPWRASSPSRRRCTPSSKGAGKSPRGGAAACAASSSPRSPARRARRCSPRPSSRSLSAMCPSSRR